MADGASPDSARLVTAWPRCTKDGAPVSLAYAKAQGMMQPPRVKGSELCKEYALERLYHIKRMNGGFV